MADLGPLKHLLLLLLSARVIIGAAVTLTSPGQSANLGSEFNFTCTVVDGNVKGLISFKRRDDKSFPSVCRVEVDSGNRISRKDAFLCSAVDGQAQTYSLTIRNVSRQDSTVWQCQAGGTQSNNVTLNVLYAPTVAIEAVSPCSGFTFLVDETNVALNCTVKGGNPAPTTFTWYHRNIIQQNETSPIYTIGTVTRSSGGRYRCTADNGISPPGQAKVKVDVHYPPTVHVGVTRKVALESDDVTIQCTAEAKPNVTSVVWTKEGVRISDNGTLHLRNIQKDAAGVYVCTATNEVTSCSGIPQTKRSKASVTLEVQYGPTVAIEAVSPCSEFTFLVDESNVALNCTVKGGNPAPTTFTWYHRNIQQNEASPIYTIGTVTRSSGGWYRCTADNGISPLGEGGVAVNVHYPPIVTGNGTKKVVNETEDVTIQCATDAEPNVTSAVWTKEGREISGSGLLHLSNIQKDAAGVYVCTATNEVTPCSGIPQTKTSSAYLTLEVQYAPRVEYFGVTSGKRTTTVREHDTVTLRCDVSSYPASTTAIRNRTSSIGSSMTSSSVIHEGYRQVLTTRLLQMSCLEGGDYTCAAGNLVGEASKTVSLQVRCVPRRDSSSSDELVFTSNLHENVTLSVTVIAFPLPTFTWRRLPNARPINTTEVIADGVRVTGSVTIYDVKEADYINYTVRVNNAEGRLDLEIPLVSKSSPHLPRNLKSVNIRPHSVTLGWDKAFNGGATQRFNIQYRQPGGQWTTHPTSPSEDDNLQLDIEGLEPGTVYEIRINAQNEHGSSNYTSVIITTKKEPTDLTIIAYAMVAVVVVIIVLTVVIVKKWRNKQKGQDTSMAHHGEENEGRVVAENDLYETSADISPSGAGAGVCNNDVYAVVNKPAKKGDPVEDLYAMPQKEKKKNRGKSKKLEDPVEDLYAMPQKEKKKNRGKTKQLEDQQEDMNAQPEKKKGKTKGKSKKKSLGAENSGGGAGDEKKEGQKTGIDEDGLLYVSVDFNGLPPASDTIKRSEEETQYVGIDFAASAAKTE